jgi:hypothetical protein
MWSIYHRIELLSIESIEIQWQKREENVEPKTLYKTSPIGFNTKPGYRKIRGNN